MTTNKLAFFTLGFSRGLTASHIEERRILRNATKKTKYMLDSAGLGQGRVMGSYKYGSKLSSYMRYG
jgi:hypothetical protein